MGDPCRWCREVPCFRGLESRNLQPQASTAAKACVRPNHAFAAVQPLICYSLKTNPNLAICKVMNEAGSGFDVTSGGELYRALAAGGTGERIVFAGVGKTEAELRYGLESKVLLFNVESEAELHALAAVAAGMNRSARVALRVNPDLPPKTHVKTDTSVKGAKFGLDIEHILEVSE